MLGKCYLVDTISLFALVECLLPAFQRKQQFAMGQVLDGRAYNLGNLTLVHRHAVNEFSIAVDDEVCIVRRENNLTVFLSDLNEIHKIFCNQRTVQVRLWLIDDNRHVTQQQQHDYDRSTSLTKRRIFHGLVVIQDVNLTQFPYIQQTKFSLQLQNFKIDSLRKELTERLPVNSVLSGIS